MNTFDFIDAECTPDNPCQNGGNCTEKYPPLDYTCECNTGWLGKNCTIGKTSSYFHREVVNCTTI